MFHCDRITRRTCEPCALVGGRVWIKTRIALITSRNGASHGFVYGVNDSRTDSVECLYCGRNSDTIGSVRKLVLSSAVMNTTQLPVQDITVPTIGSYKLMLRKIHNGQRVTPKIITH